MRGLVLLFVVAMAACGLVLAADNPAGKPVEYCSVLPKEDLSVEGFETMTEKCTVAMRAQVRMELSAALTYMAMGAHFSLDSVNRPGFAKMFFASASEEREHAFKIIEYLLMRGLLGGTDINDIIPKELKAEGTKWNGPLEAMKEALKLEIKVTKSITAIVKDCENAEESTKLFNNDFHLVDYLTGEFLEEQLHGQRELAGRIATLGKMIDTQGALAEFLYDKKLLNGEPL